ncbi:MULTISPECIES: hypothetical protein [Cupriavidus]|jgi:hypothetical protein|uniref:hypothetical protein n=1 Tax=Cupriavidus TaxID=106589 RepID=UPI0004667E01|nr:hypothetical protein [Cupriavidus metallidurans]KWW32409.1 hypothetical protein AU374_06009 [Cupriavidus metallidurans]
MAAAAPIVDRFLADLLAGEPDPVELLVEDQTHAMAWKMGQCQDAMMKHGRLVALSCGHFTMTKALHRAKCRRCGEMIRAGYDYDAFRNRGESDRFSWPSDPLRPLHERDEAIENKFSPI